MDPRINEAVPIRDEKHAKELKDAFGRSINEAKCAGRISELQSQTMLLNGPPVFEKDEVIEIKGYRFRIARIDSKKMILRPVKT